MLAALLASPWSSVLGVYWRAAAYLKISVQAALFVVR
jgi:hypothetical protein